MQTRARRGGAQHTVSSLAGFPRPLRGAEKWVPLARRARAQGSGRSRGGREATSGTLKKKRRVRAASSSLAGVSTAHPNSGLRGARAGARKGVRTPAPLPAGRTKHLPGRDPRGLAPGLQEKEQEEEEEEAGEEGAARGTRAG